MNRIVMVLCFLSFSSLIQAKIPGVEGLVPCFEESPAYMQRMLGVWERKEGQRTRRGEHGIPWGAQFKKITLTSDERIFNEFADVVTDKKDFCVYMAGTMETVRRSGKTRSYPFAILNVDDTTIIFWISGVKEGFKETEAMTTEIRLTWMPQEDLLLLGGEYAEDEKITYQHSKN